MRFMRGYVRSATGELLHVMHLETPFAEASDVRLYEPAAGGEILRVDLEMHELGMAEDFAPTDVKSGEPCDPGAHVLQRLDAVKAAGGGVRFVPKRGHEAQLPTFHDVPTTLAGIRRLAAEKGGAAVPAAVSQWLEFMGALSPEELTAAGLARLTVERALELDIMRAHRDPTHRSRAAEIAHRDAVRREEAAAQALLDAAAAREPEAGAS